MPASKPLAHWRALRALAEGARPTLDILADAGKCSLKMLKSRAVNEGWQLSRASQEDWLTRLRSLAAIAIERLDAIARQAIDGGGKIDKEEVDSLIAILRSIEKAGEFMRPDEVANENKKDEELAAVLGRINDRILELAKDLAAQMVAAEHRAPGSGPGQGRVGS